MSIMVPHSAVTRDAVFVRRSWRDLSWVADDVVIHETLPVEEAVRALRGISLRLACELDQELRCDRPLRGELRIRGLHHVLQVAPGVREVALVKIRLPALELRPRVPRADRHCLAEACDRRLAGVLL